MSTSVFEHTEHSFVPHGSMTLFGLLEHVAAHLHVIESRLKALEHLPAKVQAIMATQDEINALITQVSDAVGILTTETDELTAAVVAIQAEIASLQAAGVDITGLQAAVGNLSTVANNIKAAADAVESIPPVV